MKRAVVWVGAILALLAAIAGGLWLYAFGSNKPIVAGPIAPGVFEVKDGFVNAFILDVGPGKVALIDAGNDKTASSILEALAARGLAPSSVAAIFLTHGHPDHFAGARKFSDAAVYVMDPDVALVGDGAKVTHPLKDGEVVTIGDLRVESFLVPGHTPGSAVYLARGVLFFGDSAGAAKDDSMMKAVGLFSKDSGQNVASLKALDARLGPRKSEVVAMAFGHTGSVRGLDALTAFAAKP